MADRAGTAQSSGLSMLYTRREIRFILAFALLGTLFDGAELNLIGYPLAYVSASLHVSTLALIKVATVQGFASILGGFVFGSLGDILGRRRTFAISVIAFGIAATWGGLATGYDSFLLSRLLAGVGMGGLFGLSFSMFTECWQTKKRGTMGGIIQSMYFVGEILTEGILFFFLTTLGHDLGWRAGYITVGLTSLVIGIASLKLLPESKQWLVYQEHRKAGTLPDELRRSKVPVFDIFRPRFVYGTVVFMVLSTAMFLTTNSVGAYLSTYLLKTQKLNLPTVSLIVLLGYIATIITYSVTGIISDRVRRKYAFTLASVFGTIGFTWFLWLLTTGNAHITANFWSAPTFWALMMCTGAAGGFGVLGVWMSEFFPTRIRSTGASASYYVGRGLGAGIFPLFALTIAGAVPFALALGIIGPLAGVLFSVFAPDRTGRTIADLE
ncbi:MFS transporter [Arthrobacter sp. AETb3-4]|uniref:MFS transporter n=2 Tax=Arthrobacter wenxiniae TaxID=2713570 RepID=A0A7Y7IJP1_9MICC|nr:MFS transporter [Arthrobacter wenxiniae]